MQQCMVHKPFDHSLQQAKKIGLECRHFLQTMTAWGHERRFGSVAAMLALAPAPDSQAAKAEVPTGRSAIKGEAAVAANVPK